MSKVNEITWANTPQKWTHTHACLVSCACECDRFRCVPVLPSFIKERKLQICPALMDFDFNLHSFCLPFPLHSLQHFLKCCKMPSPLDGEEAWLAAEFMRPPREKWRSFSFGCCCSCCPCHKTLTTTKLQENYPLMSNIYGRDGSSRAGKTLSTPPPPEVEVERCLGASTAFLAK